MSPSRHSRGNNLGRALDLLNRQRPQPGQRDLRGWEWRYLWQQTRSDATFTLCQQFAEINSLAVSPDGFSLAIGSAHQGLSVWDLRTRQELVRLEKMTSSSAPLFHRRNRCWHSPVPLFLPRGNGKPCCTFGIPRRDR